MITRSPLESVAEESGFRPVAVEKVLRLCNILLCLSHDPATEGSPGVRVGVAGVWGCWGSKGPPMSA